MALCFHAFRGCLISVSWFSQTEKTEHHCEGKWADSRQGTVREEGLLEPSVIRLSTHFREAEVADKPRVIPKGGLS